MPLLGYVHSLGAGPWSSGIGVYAQGGMGVDFQDVMTRPGTKDQLTSQVAFLRLNPLVAYKLNEASRSAATLMIGYSQCEVLAVPGTTRRGWMARSDGGDFRMNVTASRVRVRRTVGAQYKLGPMVRVGATYTDRVHDQA